MRKHYVVPLEKKERAKCRKWQLRVDSGRKTPSGAISWKTRKVVGKTWTQANEICDAWAADLDDGRAVAPEREWTFAEYRKHWIEDLVNVGMRSPGTQRLRKASLAAAGLHLDKYKLGEIKTSHINAMTSALMRGDSPSRLPASGTYARKIVESVRLMLDSAVKDGLVASNEAREAYMPNVDTPERRLVTMSEISQLEAQLDVRDWHQRVLLVLSETGMRLCEAMALKWGDWDEQLRTVRVTKSKNGNGLRLVPVTKTLGEGLSVARFHLQLELGQDDISQFAISCDDAGLLHSRGSMHQWWRARRSEYGLDDVTLHQLRHAMVSHLLANGATLRQIQDIIGDKTGSVVLGVYAHTSMDERANAMASLDVARRVQSVYKNAGS